MARARFIKVRVEAGSEIDRYLRKYPELERSLQRKPITNIRTQHEPFCEALSPDVPESECRCVRGIVLRQAY